MPHSAYLYIYHPSSKFLMRSCFLLLFPWAKEKELKSRPELLALIIIRFPADLLAAAAGWKSRVSSGEGKKERGPNQSSLDGCCTYVLGLYPIIECVTLVRDCRRYRTVPLVAFVKGHLRVVSRVTTKVFDGWYSWVPSKKFFLKT